jgi:small subunit ribosomal protein S17
MSTASPAPKKAPAPAQQQPPQAQQQETHGFRRKMIGKVVRPSKNQTHAYGKRPGVAPKTVGNRMNKTVVVEVVSHTRDPLYGKYVRSRARYKAHDEKNEYNPGDEVEIQEHSPISRDKRFIVVRLIKKFVEE